MPRRLEAAVERGMDRTAAIVQTSMDRTAAIVDAGMDEVKTAASPAREILQRFLNAGEFRLKFGGVAGTLFGNEIVIPIPPKELELAGVRVVVVPGRADRQDLAGDEDNRRKRNE